jgi:hypothetical protein
MAKEQKSDQVRRIFYLGQIYFNWSGIELIKLGSSRVQSKADFHELGHFEANFGFDIKTRVSLLPF